MQQKLQLYVYDTNDFTRDAVRRELDLYEEEPLKLTISAESLTDVTRIDSSFSRSFRIPATQNNSQVFRWWYEVNTIDFDVTKTVLGEIHVDGVLYKTGQIRLQGAYKNRYTDRVDLEIFFLGETKTFSTQVGENYMDSLNLGDTAHDLTLTALQNSWLPLSNPSVFLDGKIRYIVADRGYTYTNGVIDQNSQIALGNAGVRQKNIELSASALPLNQFTPLIQVKYLIDKIFELTDYTYSADSVFNEDWFKELYTDGISTPSSTFDTTGANFEAELFQDPLYSTAEQVIEFYFVTLNENNVYNSLTGIYTAPVTGSYSFEVEINGDISKDPFGPNPIAFTRLYRNTTVIDSQSTTVVGGGNFNHNFTWAGTLNEGDELYVTFEPVNSDNNDNLFYSYFKTLTSPLSVNPSSWLKSDVKIIDFYRSILTKFRCVMVPSKSIENQFIIQPWNDYIASGDLFDWTELLDESKDVQLRPIFFNQSANIKFFDQTDEDRRNKKHFESYNKIYGERFYYSNNDLLRETREVSTIFAPTPVDQIVGSTTGSDFIIPYFFQDGNDLDVDGNIERTPLLVVPRLLFWNGLANLNAATETWFYTDGVSAVATAQYPRASYLTEIPSTATSLNLNWQKTFAYFRDGGAGPEGELGQDVFQRYWFDYINSLYSSEARMMTAYFTIDANNLRDLTFDDVIFVKNSYWRLQKVYDAPLTDVASVKVDLIKLQNYKSCDCPPAASFNYRFEAETNQICVSDTSTCDPTVWRWTITTPRGSFGSSLQNWCFSVQAGDFVTMELEALNQCGSDTDIQTFTVPGGLPVADFTYAIDDEGRTVTFTNTSTGATSYFWDFGDGNTSTATNPVHTYAQVQGTELFPDRTVELFATNALGFTSHVETFQVTQAPIETQAWWRASDGITLNGSDVSQWDDKIAGIPLQQGGASAQPAWNNADPNFNNKPTITFARADQNYLISPSNFDSYYPLTPGDDVSYIFVYRTTYTANQHWGLHNYAARMNLMTFDGGPRVRFDNMAATSPTRQILGTNATWTGTNWMAGNYEASTGAYEFLKNGTTTVLSGTGNVNAQWAETNCRIYAGAISGIGGAATPYPGYYFEGELVEMWVLYRKLTATDISNFNAYLAARYGM